VKVAGAKLGDAALGVGDPWNHGVVLSRCLVSTVTTHVERGPILRFRSGERIVEIAEVITEFALRRRLRRPP
jgi:hypothetical protein